MTVAELIATLALDFEDQASAKASKAARSLEASLRGINIEGAIKGDPFSRTYKYVNAFRDQFRVLSKELTAGLDLKIKGKQLPGVKTLINNIEKIDNNYVRAKTSLDVFNNAIKEATSLYADFGQSGVMSSEEIDEALGRLAYDLREVKANLSSVRISPELNKEIRGSILPAVEEMIKAFDKGGVSSKTAFEKAVEGIKDFDLINKVALTGLQKLIQEIDLLNKKTEQFYTKKNIMATPTTQLGGAYTDILSKLGKTRSELSQLLGLLSSEFEYVPRMAERVRSQVAALAKSGYDLSNIEVRNIKKVVQYRDIELQSLQVKANLLRAGLVSEQEAVNIIKQASNYAQKYNLELKDVLTTLNMSTKDWATFYIASLKSDAAVQKIRTELDTVNLLLREAWTLGKSINSEVLIALRRRQKELELEAKLIEFEDKRVFSVAEVVKYYDLIVEKVRASLGIDISKNLKQAIFTIAEINTQLESQYNIESNIAKLRKIIADSYIKDFDIIKLIETSGLTREKIEESIAIAREQSIKSLQLQYELGILNESSQAKLRDELLQQTELTREQQVLLGKLNTELSIEKSAYSNLLAEQERLNNLLKAQKQYLSNLKVTSGSSEDIKDAERILSLIKERKRVVDETLSVTQQLTDLSDRNVKDVEREVRSRVEAEKVLRSITKEKINQLTTDIESLKSVSELRAKEQQILNILKTTTKFVTANGKLTKEWRDRTKKLEETLGIVREKLRKIEAETSRTQKTISGARSILSGFFNIRLVGVFMLYRTLWELRRAFSDLAKSAMEVEDKMKKFETITLATTESVSLATDTVKDLSTKYALAATDIADALIKIGQAGYTAQESISLISSTSQLAVATGSELGDTVNLMLSAMQAWDLETSKSVDIANIFTSAINSTRLTVDRLNTSFNYITGIAPQLNITLEETAAILGTMADAGIRASTSGTSMRAMFAELLKPSNRLIDTLSDLGLTIEDVDPQLHTVTDILITLKKAGFSAADAFRAFGRRGASGIAVLVANADKVAQLSTSFNNYARAASLAAIASESLQARLTIFWNSLRAEVMNVVPAITHFIDAISGLRDIKITSTGIEFTKTVGEIVLSSESASKRLNDLTLSMQRFNDAVAEVRGLEQAGLLIQAISKAYKTGLVPLAEYNKLMKEYNERLAKGTDITDTFRKAQDLLNGTIKRNIELEKVRRIIEFTDAIEKQAAAERKVREAFRDQNKEITRVLTTWQDYQKAVSKTSPLEALGEVGLGLTPQIDELERTIANVQKLLGSPLSSEWLKSLKSQSEQLTGITKDASNQLYKFIKVIELAGPEFAKKLVTSGKDIDEYSKSLQNFINMLKKQGSLKDISLVDTKNIRELAKYPKLFTELAIQSVRTSEDIDALRAAFKALIDDGILPVTEGGIVQEFVNKLNSSDIQTKSLSTSINILQQRFDDLYKTLSRATSNFKDTVKPLQEVQTITLKYAQTLERLNLVRELAHAGITDYSKKLSELTNVQKIQIDQQKALQAKQTYLIDKQSITTGLQLLEQTYKRQLELAKGNADKIRQINSWRAENETRLYSDMSVAALKYKNTIDRLVKEETSALQRLYQQLNNVNTQLQQNEISLELSLKNFDAAVKTKLEKMSGTTKNTFDRLKKEARSISSLISEARLYADEAKGKVYLQQAEQKLNALKSAFLSTNKLSEDQVRSLSHRIKALMKDLAEVKDSVLEDQKTTLEAQINMMRKSLDSLVTEMKSSMDAVRKSLQKQGELKIKDNIDTEIVPRFNDLIEKITDSKPELKIKHNLGDVKSDLEDINDLLDDISHKGKINISVSGGGGKSIGGYIPGYGGGDIVPTWLEPGEFVIRKEVVRDFGVDFFRNINEGVAFNTSFPKMQYGGMIPEVKAKDIVNVNLNLGSSQFPLFGEREVVEMLVSRLQKERLMSI